MTTTEKTMDKKQLLHSFRTQEILIAARKVIADKGLDKATMEQVAEKAGISKATIYLYFKNKESLYFHCVIEKFDEVMVKMREAAEKVADPIERLTTLLTVQVTSLEEEKDFFRVFLTERMGIFLDRESGFGQQFAERHRAYTGLISSIISEAVGKGRIRDIDPDKAAYILFSMLRGTAMSKIIMEDETPLSNDVGFIVDVFLNGVLRKDA